MGSKIRQRMRKYEASKSKCNFCRCFFSIREGYRPSYCGLKFHWNCPTCACRICAPIEKSSRLRENERTKFIDIAPYIDLPKKFSERSALLPDLFDSKKLIYLSEALISVQKKYSRSTDQTTPGDIKYSATIHIGSSALRVTYNVASNTTLLDNSTPAKIGGYYYYDRIEEGKPLPHIVEWLKDIIPKTPIHQSVELKKYSLIFDNLFTKLYKDFPFIE